MQGGPTTPHWPESPTLPAVVEATSFSLGTRPAADFAWTGPEGAYPPDKAPASTVLEVGERPPAFQGRTAKGDLFATADVQGPAVYLFSALWCPPCEPETEAVSAEMAARPSLAGVLVTMDEAGTAVGHYGEHPTTMTLVADVDNVFGATWGIPQVPTLVVLDADGRVAGMRGGLITRENVARILDAAVAGGPIPSVPLVEEFSWDTPLPSFTVDGTPRPRLMSPDPQQSRISDMPLGGLMPAWEGPLVQGGRFDSAALAGRPAVVWFYPACGNCPTDDLDAMASAAREVGDRVSVVLVAQSEPSPGWTADLLAAHGITLPVVFDWDGEISNAVGLVMMGAQVFDAEGRLVDERVAPPSLDELRVIADTLGPSTPSASPSASP